MSELLPMAQIYKRNIYRRSSEPKLIMEIPQKDVASYLCDIARAHNAAKFKDPFWCFTKDTSYTISGWRSIAEDICARFLGIVAVRREGDPARKEAFNETWPPPRSENQNAWGAFIERWAHD